MARQLSEMEKVEEALEANRAREAVIREHCWNEFESIMKPFRGWMERIISARHPTKREEELYKQQLDAAYKKAMSGLWKLHNLTNESAKLRTRLVVLRQREANVQRLAKIEAEKQIKKIA